MRAVAELDGCLLEWVRQHRSPRLTAAMRALTRLGSVEVLTPLASAATIGLWARRQRRSAVFLGATALGSTIMNQGLKAVFARARPDAALHLSRTGGFAFPSGHSMASAAIYGALAMVVGAGSAKLGIIASAASGLCVVAVGVSRAYLYVHYPSDIAIGWALGLAWPLSLQGLLPVHGGWATAFR
jgi:membrane-associated phospholipid phosphatase